MLLREHFIYNQLIGTKEPCERYMLILITKWSTMRLITVTNQETNRIYLAAKIMEEHIREPYTVTQLASKVKLSQIKLKYGFKQVYGVAPYSYLLEIRMRKAKSMLLAEQPIKAIAMTIGYKSESNFCKAFKKVCHESPRSWLKSQLKQTG